MGTQIGGRFDYTELTPDAQQAVRDLTAEINQGVRRTALEIVAVGERLVQVRGWMSNRQFGHWREQETRLSRATALRFMQVARLVGSRSNNLLPQNLPISVLYLLAAPTATDAVVQEVLDRAAQNERITVKEARAAVSPPRRARESGPSDEVAPAPPHSPVVSPATTVAIVDDDALEDRKRPEALTVPVDLGSRDGVPPAESQPDTSPCAGPLATGDETIGGGVGLDEQLAGDHQLLAEREMIIHAPAPAIALPSGSTLNLGPAAPGASTDAPEDVRLHAADAFDAAFHAFFTVVEGFDVRSQARMLGDADRRRLHRLADGLKRYLQDTLIALALDEGQPGDPQLQVPEGLAPAQMETTPEQATGIPIAAAMDRVAEALDGPEERMTAREIAERKGLTPQRVGALLSSLERQGRAKRDGQSWLGCRR